MLIWLATGWWLLSPASPIFACRTPRIDWWSRYNRWNRRSFLCLKYQFSLHNIFHISHPVRRDTAVPEEFEKLILYYQHLLNYAEKVTHFTILSRRNYNNRMLFDLWYLLSSLSRLTRKTSRRTRFTTFTKTHYIYMFSR